MTRYPVTLKTVDAAGHGRVEDHTVSDVATLAAAVQQAARLVLGRDLDDITAVTITVERPGRK